MSDWPSKSVALPVSANGVRVGIVYCAAVVTVGAWLPVGVMIQPLLSTGPPLAVSPTYPVKPLTFVKASWLVFRRPSVPPKVTWNPKSLKIPAAPNGATVAVAPIGSMPGVPLTVSATEPVTPPTPFVTATALTSVPWWTPLNVSVNPVSVSEPTATVPPTGQPATATLPLASSRTELVQPPVQLTIEIDGTSTFAEAPAKVSVNPPLPALADVTVPAKPGMALTAAATFAFEIASPPEPSTAERLPPMSTWNDCVAPLNPVRIACCCSFPPWRAFWMPAAVSF